MRQLCLHLSSSLLRKVDGSVSMAAEEVVVEADERESGAVGKAALRTAATMGE